MTPRTHARISQNHMTVHRVDIVDAKGVIRMTLASPTPPPILDGVQYKRILDATGILYFDNQGNERGGMAIADIPGSAVVLASDHENSDAIGWRVMPDGSIRFVMNQKAAVVRAVSVA